ncbi:MAG: Fe-S cluster assembly protein NifU [Candidatus Riflebacteria bacterium]|nr:Fe-S cluster assembly protein NifU [Candidatus Riflebacteria bacterium]
MWDYTKSVMDHFVNPRNVGEIEDANAVGQAGSIACGDALKLFLNIDPATEKILDAKFKTFGCASAIASASALTEIIRGKTLKEAETLSNDDIVKFLGGLPETKMHCSVMGREALEDAIAYFRGEKGSDADKKHEHDEKIVCKCFWVSEEKIRRVIRENKLTKVEEVTNFTKAGGACGGCLADIQLILDEENRPVDASGSYSTAPVKEKKLTNLQKIALIQEVLKNDVAPMLNMDGGNIELVDVDSNLVLVRLHGACSHCAGAKATLQNLVQQKLREKVSPELFVKEATE